MNIVFILVEPAVPENVGAAARAIKTMGIDELRLVKPCNHLSDPARWLAHASNDILENATVFDKLSLALEDIDFSIATSAKTRHVKADYYPIDAIATIIKNKGNSIEKLALVFGREESGLTNPELSLCDLVSYVPMKTQYPSLNLAQSVMLYAYTLSGYYSTSTPEQEETKTVSFKVFKTKTEEALTSLEFSRGSNIYNRLEERLALLRENDMHLVLSVCNKVLEKYPLNME